MLKIRLKPLGRVCSLVSILMPKSLIKRVGEHLVASHLFEFHSTPSLARRIGQRKSDNCTTCGFGESVW
nr:MAG TPA: hypothetical protein [Caudoviricetes sp.]